MCLSSALGGRPCFDDTGFTLLKSMAFDQNDVLEIIKRAEQCANRNVGVRVDRHERRRVFRRRDGFHRAA